MTIKEWQEEIHKYAIDKGWWNEPRPIPELLCLMHSEISESLEAYRAGFPDTWDNFKEELADLVIRVMDTCEALDIDLEKEINKKHQHNLTRPYRHGGKKC